MFQFLFFNHSPAWIRPARLAGWALSFAAVLLLLQSSFWSGHVPLALKVGVGAVAILAAVRPAEALLLLAALVPFGQVLATTVWNAYPFALGEALVLAFLAGYLWRQRRATPEASSPADGLVIASKLFALVILASCLVQIAVLQVWHDYPQKYVVNYAAFLATEYLTSVLDPRPWVDGRGFISTGALMLEGVALMLCARTLCGQQPGLARRLTNVIVTAGVGAALLSVYAVTTVALSTNQPLRAVIASGRFASPAIPSLDTAGPYFMLVAFLAIGTAAASRTHMLAGLVAAVIALAAMGLTETRSAIVAGLTTAAAWLVWRGSDRVGWLSPARALLVSGVAALAVGMVVLVYNPFHLLAAGGDRSMHLRALFAETGLRMMASAPLVGVGVGQYEVRYREFASPELLRVDATNSFNAHNHFLWMGAETGLAGLSLFVWIVSAALARAWSQVRARPFDHWFLGIFGGLVAFMITWVIGQPLVIPQVAYTFWILLGLAAGYSTDATRSAPAGRPLPRLTRLALAATVVLVVGLVPIRAARAISEIDLSRVSYGFYGWDTTNEGPRLLMPAPGRGAFRWTGPRATFFMRSSVAAIDIPLAASIEAVPQGVQVEIVVDGQTPRRIRFDDGQWRPVTIDAPASARRFWRVDLHVAPTWIPRIVLQRSPDERELGIAVGEISIKPPQDEAGRARD